MCTDLVAKHFPFQEVLNLTLLTGFTINFGLQMKFRCIILRFDFIIKLLNNQSINQSKPFIIQHNIYQTLCFI